MTAEITPETLGLAGEGATTLDCASNGGTWMTGMKELRKQAAAIRSLIARATETCEWKEYEDGYWQTSCGHVRNVGIWQGPSSWGFVYCFICGKRLTETKRPATTGEMMGEK